MSISSRLYTYPSGLFGLLKMMAFVFELNKFDNSAGSNFQSAEDVTPSFFVCVHVMRQQAGILKGHSTLLSLGHSVYDTVHT